MKRFGKGRNKKEAEAAAAKFLLEFIIAEKAPNDANQPSV